MPNITIIEHEWGIAASCSCGWSHTVHTHDPVGEGIAHIMALVEAHLEAHRRQS
jgi:hypothetical protein